MSIRSMTDFPRNEQGLVDNFIGTAYDVVKEVYVALPELREIHAIVDDLPELGEAAVEEAMVPARTELAEGIAKAQAWAEGSTPPNPAAPNTKSAKSWAAEAEISVGKINKTNVQYPFNFIEGVAQYDVGVISGDPQANTTGLALWIEGAIEYDFTILDAKRFALNSPSQYVDGAQMRIIINARFDDIIGNFTGLQNGFAVEFNESQLERAEAFESEKDVRTEDYLEYLAGLSLELSVGYGPFLTMSRPTQTIIRDGVLYRPRAQYLPFNTSTWTADEAKFAVANDLSIREDFALDTGAGLSGFSMAVPYAPNTLGSRIRNFQRAFFNPLDAPFNAVGDGVANDTAAVAACIAACPDDAVLWIPGDRVFRIPGGVTVTQTNLQITGGGTFKDGPVLINQSAVGVEMMLDINHIRFFGNLNTINGIELIKGRRVTITNCIFQDSNAGVHRRGDVGQVFHSVAMIRIQHNDFLNVNYALRVANNGAVDAWAYTSDCAFDNNTINVARVCGIDIAGIDGAHITGNVMFTTSFNGDPVLKAAKTYNIKVGQSDWLIIANNNLFEAGLESILLDTAKHFSITNNHIAWPGQREPRDAIRLTGGGEPNGVISGNTLSRFTRHGISVETNLGGATLTNINVFGNTFEFTLSPPSYFGTTPLNSIPHFTIYEPDNCPTLVINHGNSSAVGGLSTSIRSRLAEGNMLGLNASVAATAPITKTVPAATPTALAKITAGMNTVLTTSYSGMLLIQARPSPGTLSSNMASYILHVSKVPGQTGVVGVISAQGLVAGAGTNHPSFTFSIVGDYLTVTPVVATVGDFVFTITALGQLGVYL
ncbi:hypothetical protein D3C86_1093950 [compost metagenome]